MTNAAITPGTHPIHVSISTMSTEPHPLSKTENGGNTMASMTLSSDIIFFAKIIIKNENKRKMKKKR